jgi:hypothetical protein
LRRPDFSAKPWKSNGLFVIVALIWFASDRRIERAVLKREKE